MKRYFELVYLPENETAKSVFFKNGDYCDILGMISVIMRGLEDLDLGNYRLFEYKTKRAWEEKQNEMKVVIDERYSGYWVMQRRAKQ